MRATINLLLVLVMFVQGFGFSHNKQDFPIIDKKQIDTFTDTRSLDPTNQLVATVFKVKQEPVVFGW